ncbi:hypothetical protein E3P86_02923 [Wallemia ichthyophaga]|uniref:Cyclin-like domain-containing protein n=1 Tax=Wallemia ichthyophaga TaxID=245174 RepID=A0A4V4M4L9_WALIC|nr:hypothetical protein E3P86_02923 [Wallemia ichthyophaga]
MAYRGSQQGYNRQPPAMYQARHHQGYNNGYGYPHDYPSPWRFQPHYQAPPDRSVARSRPYSNHSTQQYNSSRPQHPTHSSQPSHTGNHHHQQQHQQQQQRQKRRADPQAVKKEQDRRDDLIALEKERRLLLSRTNPHIKHFEPYFNQAEAEILSQRQHGKFSHRQAGEIKRFSTAFIEKLGNQLGFPRRTIATAQTLYTRFHLFYPIKDFNPHDVAVVATFISAKMHDTLKKLHQVVAVSMHIRFPEKYKSPSIDDSVFETEKKRLLPIERLLLESISFSFKLKRPFDILIKLCRLLKELLQDLLEGPCRLTSDTRTTAAFTPYTRTVVDLSREYTCRNRSPTPRDE